MVKACCIYKTKKNYKLVTLYQTDTGSYVLKDPIVILGIDSSAMALGEALSSCLSSSTLINYPERSSAKELLTKLKEPSYKVLYENSTSCNLFLENEELTIEPNRCVGASQGLEVVTEDIQRIKYTATNLTEVTQRIIESLNKKY